MQDRLEALTERLYQEGIQKAQEEKAHILAEAEKAAAEMLEQARKEADGIREEAVGAAESLRAQTEKELALAVEKMLSVARSRLESAIQVQAASQAVDGTFRDPQFVQDLILRLTDYWLRSSQGSGAMWIDLPQHLQEEMEGFLATQVEKVLAAGVSVHFDPSLPEGVVVRSAEGGYRWQFTEEGFRALFEHFLSAHTRKRLSS